MPQVLLRAQGCPQSAAVYRINRSRKDVHVGIHLSDQGTRYVCVMSPVPCDKKMFFIP